MGNEIIENVQGVEPTPFLLTRLQNAVESVSDHYDKLEEGYVTKLNVTNKANKKID